MEDSTLLPNPRGSPTPPKKASECEQESAKSASGDWRPLSLTKPVLLAALVLSLLLFACIEILAQRSQKQGGLAFYPSADDIPGRISFAYNYVPTIIATFFSLLWTWIDLDIKRVQPWIALSRPDGAIARDSILLDYSSDLLPYAPIRAAKLKHWPAFSSGAAAVLILWVLTPLQATLLGSTSLSQMKPTTVTGRSQLLPLDEQLKSETFLQFSYSIATLNQSYPSFTTAKYALLPFYLEERPSLSTASTNWTAETTKLWAEADCSPIKSDFLDIDSNEFNYKLTGSGGCMANVTFTVSQSAPQLRYADNTEEKYTGTRDWICFNDPAKQYYDNEDRYYSNTSYSAVIYWTQRILNPKNATQVSGFNISGIQCELSYHKQQVVVTVDSKTRQPYHDTMEPVSKQTMLASTEFNDTAFTSAFPMDSNGGDNEPDSTWPLSQDYAETVFPDLEPTIYQGSPMELIFRYILLGRNYTLSAFYDQSEQHALFQDGIQKFFSLAVSTRLANQTTGLDDTGSSTTVLTSIVVSRPFSIASEVLLLLSALVLGYLSYSMKSSACALGKIPSSIRDLIDVAHDNTETAKLFQSLDTADEKLMRQALGNITLRVTTDGMLGRSKLLIAQGSTMVSDEEDNRAAKPYYKPIKPWILRRGTGVVLALALVAAIVVVSYFKCMERKYNGLPRPSKSFEVMQLLENYIPTAFSTVIEPFWVLLARTMCIYQPFKDLWKGRAPANRSIETTYTAVPPQLTLLKSISSRKILLSLLCLAAFLANVLAIGVSALFNERPVVVKFDQEFQPLYQSRINSSTLLYLVDQSTSLENQKAFMYTVYANMTENTQLPPWVSTEYYFQPTKAISDDKSAGYEYTVRTRGFGVDLECTPHPESTHALWANPYSALPIQYNLSCIDPVKEVLSNFVLGMSGTEFEDDDKTSMMASSYSFLTYLRDEPSICGPNVTFGWARAPQGLKVNNTIYTTYAECQPVLKTAMFDTTVDEDGYVLGYQRVSNLESGLDYSNATRDINLLLGVYNYATAETNHEEWRNVSSTRSWFTQYMSMDIGSRNFSDPELPVPDPEVLIPTLGRVYSRLFPAFMSNMTNILSNSESKTSIMGTRSTEETRIFMDKTAFIITITVLAVDLLIALAFYLPETLYILPRPPSSAGSILAYIAPSRAVRDGTPPSGWKDQTFSFGRYIGYDGKSYIGVEMDKYVVEKDASLGTYKPLFSGKPLGNILSGKNSRQDKSS